MRIICRGEPVERLFCVGEMVIDFLPGEEPDSYIRKAGGAPANVAIAVSRQGHGAAFAGMMGNDDFGRFLIRTLEENGVEPCVRELTEEAVTTMTFVTLDEQGDRSFTFAQKSGADTMLKKEHITREQLEGADIIHAGSCSLAKGTAAEATAYAMEWGKALEKLVSFDVNYRNLKWNDNEKAAVAAVEKVLPFVDFFKISEEEVDMFGGEAGIPSLMERYDIALTVETLGSRGARCYWNGNVLQRDGIKADCVDTCGAGDAFWGGFLAALMDAGIHTAKELSEDLLYRAMERGNIAGSLCVEKKGAIESLPSAEQVTTRGKELYGWKD